MRFSRRTDLQVRGGSAFAGFRFPPEVIVLAVRWYLRFGLSYRDVEELLAERGIEVDHVTIYRWVRRFTPLLADAARFARHRVGDRWHVEETYVKVAGALGVPLSGGRPVRAGHRRVRVHPPGQRSARRFVQRARTSAGMVPSDVITDRAFAPGPDSSSNNATDPEPHPQLGRLIRRASAVRLTRLCVCAATRSVSSALAGQSWRPGRVAAYIRLTGPSPGIGSKCTPARAVTSDGTNA